MNTAHESFNGFADMDDELLSTPTKPKTVEQSIDKWNDKGSASKQGAIYEEPCKDCRGTGRFRSWSGRVVGSCFKCDGTGKMKFKTSPEQRAKNAAKAAEKKVQVAADRAVKMQQFTDANRAEVEFVMANMGWSEFYASMFAALRDYGTLTDNQLTAVRNGMAKAATRDAERNAAQAARVEAAPVVNALVKAFADARANGLKKPRLQLWNLQLSTAPDHGVNAGHIYVKHDGEYAGKVTPAGKFLSVRSCPQEVVDLVAKLGEDVLEQAVAYGKSTGTCSCCGRHLENELSVELGIGPICRGKWGL